MPIVRYEFRVWHGGFRIVCRGPKSGLKRRASDLQRFPSPPLFPPSLVSGLDNIALLAEAIESGGSAAFSRRFDDAIRQWRHSEDNFRSED